ncbi:MAG: hypothetical protein ACM3Q2_04105 [Syntrophothermus sp.]
MRSLLLLIVNMIIFQGAAYAQMPADSILENAYLNAKKGYWWALENIPKKKQQTGHDLISDNRLISSVKLSKEINGIRVESEGYSETCEVRLLIFRSTDSLLKDGFIKPDTAVVQAKPEPVIKPVRRKKSASK